MRLFRVFGLVMLISFALILSFSLPVSAKMPAAGPQTYTVMVGLENPTRGVEVNAYFPDSVIIHVGDTVHWMINSNEIHTVTFLAGQSTPGLIIPAESLGLPMSPSPLILNPAAVNPVIPPGALYNGSSLANSGLMGREPGQATDFSLTFTTTGTYDYVCLVHGSVMSGEVEVVAQDTPIPTPNQVMAQGKQEMAQDLSQVPAVERAAQAQIVAPTVSLNGTVDHHVMIGYSSGQIDVLQFFPDKLVVRPGDTVTWEMSPNNDAPHTVTFLNGEKEPGLVTPVEQASGPPLLYINPETLFPSGSGTLTRDGMFSSGMMLPVPGTTYTLTIGDMTPGLQPFICLLHDTSGMKGELMVVPKP